MLFRLLNISRCVLLLRRLGCAWSWWRILIKLGVSALTRLLLLLDQVVILLTPVVIHVVIDRYAMQILLLLHHNFVFYFILGIIILLLPKIGLVLACLVQQSIFLLG